MIGIYIHWPYCTKICPYCNFNRYLNKYDFEDKWLLGIKKQINFFSEHFPAKDKITSIFFGGGSPSLLKPVTIEKIINYISKKFDLSNTVEISLEANPNSSEASNFLQLKAAGINRLSIGIQSLDDAELKILGRLHSSKEALSAYDIARRTFSNVSCDFIYGLYVNGLDSFLLKKWLEQAKQIAKLEIQHISLYQLTIEKNTAFYNRVQRGENLVLDDDQLSIFFKKNDQIFADSGYDNYEVSNFAKKGYQSIHNLNYWLYGSWYGFGPGASGRLNRDNQTYSVFNLKLPKAWYDNIISKKNYGVKITPLTEKETVYEKVVCGLRLTQGIKLDDTIQAYLNLDVIDELKNEKLLRFVDDNLCLTSKGRLILNSIATELLN